MSSAIVFSGVNEVQITSLELPPLNDPEVLIDNHVTGVSPGTERWALLGQRPEMKFPNIPGYLGVGVIKERGQQVEHLCVGQRLFYTIPRWLSPHGSNSWMGTHASSVVVPVKDSDELPFYLPVPEDVDDISAALAGLAAVAVQGADMVRVDSTKTVLVLGLGLIGQSAAQIYQARGARVVVADLVDDRVDLARIHGRVEGVTLDQSAIASQLVNVMPAEGFDIVVDTTSVSPVLKQLWELVRPGGQIVLQGYYPKPVNLPLDKLVIKHPTLVMPNGFTRSGYAYTIRLIQSGQLRLAPMVTHKVSPEESPAIYDMVLNRPNESLGIVFDWQHHLKN